MLNANESARIKLISDRQSCYRCAFPVLCGAGLGWLIVIASISASIIALEHNQYFAFTLIFSALAFAAYLSFFTYSLLRACSCDYTFELTNQEISFSKMDNLRHKCTQQLVLLADIKYAEYYPYLDSASIIFHTPYTAIDVPLWPMGKQAQDIIDFLKGAGIKIVDVQSDEAIPD